MAVCSQEKALNVLVLPDKFKGTLTAWEVGKAIVAGWRASRPQDRLELQPISDGGDGFGEVLARALRAQRCSVQTVNAAHQAQIAPWWWEPVSGTAVIESAAVIGLALLSSRQYHPFELDSHGLAAPLREAIRQGARRCLLGLGGSATNDGGFGIARALGWQFLDHQGRAIQCWSELTALARVSPPRLPLRFLEWVVAADVQNPLLGPNGATRVYGPQKGLVSSKDLVWAERCLARLAEVVD